MSKQMESFLAAQGLDWGKLRAAAGDIVGLGPKYTGPEPPGGNTFVGIWGIRMKEADYGDGVYQEFTEFPLAGVEDPAFFDDYAWPDPDAYDYEHAREVFENANPGQERAVRYSAGNPFEIYCWMTGLEESLVNLLVNPDVVKAALDHIVGFMDKRLRRTLEACGDLVDIAFFADDLGSQTGLLMSRETYLEILQPYHRRLTSTAKDAAPHVKCMLHSDGSVFDLLPDLIDAGVDVLEAVQVDAAKMEPERLKSTFRDRLCFHGAISVQQLLPHSDTATVGRECRRLVEVLGEGGGYVAAPSHAIQTGTPPENVMAMLQAVLGEDFEGVVEEARK
jgi:uroporphyrinogen decarboxylase